MGRSRKRKKQGQPDQSLESETELPPVETPGADAETDLGVDVEEGLEFGLTHINPEVHDAATVGNAIRLVDREGHAEIHSSDGRLGNVPPQFARVATHKGLTVGILIQKSSDPLTARVRLKS